jgi:deazaflavin-dependent oxidoreductase (nitroreductase family)
MRRLDRRRLEILAGRYMLNPLIRGMFRAGISPPKMVLVETVGRRTAKTRHTPLAYTREDRTLWLIAQHGRHAGWVRNLEANPRIRVRLGRRWHTGTAQLVPGDDVQARARTFAERPLGRAIAAATFRALETAPCTLRIDLDP